MEITKLYLCESTILIIRFNQALLEHNCHFFPMVVLTLYSFVKAPLDSCFKKLRKCLVEKYFKNDEGILLPTISVKIIS